MNFPLPGSGRAVVAVPAPGSGPGYWAGASSVALAEDGTYVIGYRVRNGHGQLLRAPTNQNTVRVDTG